PPKSASSKPPPVRAAWPPRNCARWWCATSPIPPRWSSAWATRTPPTSSASTTASRALVEQHRGREIDKTDGFLLMFERPIQAAAFALDYQRGLKHMSAAEGVVVRARVGIHMGDVVIWENAPDDVSRGAKPIEVEGLVKPVAARL